uniref:BRCT domain-containing protein n=1 Tax=Heterorhabditis bacteriophora TaxID=37862 RepID=A0A1I7XF60_HETBA
MDNFGKPSHSKQDPNVTVDLFVEEVAEIMVITIDDSENEMNISSDLFDSDEDQNVKQNSFLRGKCVKNICEQSSVSKHMEIGLPLDTLSEPYSNGKLCLESRSKDQNLTNSTSIKVLTIGDLNVDIEPDVMQSESSEDQLIRKRLDFSLEKMHQNDLNRARNFGDYMQLKKDKLRYQVNILSKPLVISNIFKGISIFVNGYTSVDGSGVLAPTALELRNLIQIHGGTYHCYYEYGVTTYIIASSLAAAKKTKTRKNEKFVKPDWIVDSSVLV